MSWSCGFDQDTDCERPNSHGGEHRAASAPDTPENRLRRMLDEVLTAVDWDGYAGGSAERVFDRILNHVLGIPIPRDPEDEPRPPTFRVLIIPAGASPGDVAWPGHRPDTWEQVAADAGSIERIVNEDDPILAGRGPGLGVATLEVGT